MSGGMVLSARSLASKFGFNDGDMPDELWKRLGGVEGGKVDWHKVLRKAVRLYLVPMLTPEEADAVYDIETSHNPIRSDYWAHLAPDVFALVPWEELEAMCREELDWNE